MLAPVAGREWQRGGARMSLPIIADGGRDHRTAGDTGLTWTELGQRGAEVLKLVRGNGQMEHGTGIFYLRVRFPSDAVAEVKGQMVTPSVGNDMIPTKVVKR